jgi:hypothetical protein
VVSSDNTSPNTPENTRYRAADKNQRANEPHSDPIAPSAPVHQPEVGSKCGDSDSAYKHWLDYAIGIFAFIAAIGGVLAAVFSGWQALVANQSLIASNRPWISVEPKITSGLTFDSDGGRILIEYAFKNVGHAPADVGPFFSEFYLRFPGHSDAGEAQRRFCKTSYVAGGSGKFGYTIFPDETDTSERVNELIRKENMAPALTGRDSLSPVLIGCVKYRFAFDGNEHQTGFIRHLRQTRAGLDGRIDPTQGDIPQDRLVLDKLIAAGPAD